MNEIKSWLFSVCAAAIAAGVFKMLIPEGSNRRLLQMLTGVFMLSVIVTPLLGGVKPDLPPTVLQEKDEGLSSLEETIRDRLLDTAEAAVKHKISAILLDQGIKNAKIIIKMDTGADKRISIKQIHIYIDQEDAAKTQSVNDGIKQEFNMNAEFYLTGTGQHGGKDK